MVPDSNHLPTELSMNADDKLLLQKLDAFTIGKKDVALDFKAQMRFSWEGVGGDQESKQSYRGRNVGT